jgi:predicted RNase H-like HicB family nuclease
VVPQKKHTAASATYGLKRGCRDNPQLNIGAPRRGLGLSAVLTAGGSVRIKAEMVEIQPIRVEIEREEDGRILASVPDLPGVMAYGSTEDEAVRRVKAIALQVLADMIESGENVPEPLKALFAA